MANIVEVRELTVRLGAPIRNAVIDFADMTGSLVAVLSDVVRDGRNIMGFAFNSVGRYGQGEAIRNRFAPRLLRDPAALLGPDGESFDPRRVRAALMANEKPGGHGDRSTAVAAIELATWDLAAKLAERPAYQFIAEAYGRRNPSPVVPTYAAGGYYSEDGSIDSLRDEIRAYLGLGYEHVKIKIGAASLDDDLRRIEAVLAIVGEGDRLAVDANGCFDLATAIRYGEALTPYGLRWFEEFGDPLDFELQARLSGHCAGPFATGENLFSHQDVRNLLRYASLDPGRDLLQMDPGWSYGIAEFHAILDLLDDFDWGPKNVYPHGGNLMTLHLAAGLGLGGSEAYPGVFQPFGGFPTETEVREGVVEIPDVLGFGLEHKRDLRPLLAKLAGREGL